VTNKKPVMISVIIPCRNERSYIKRFIDSLIAQDYPTEYLEILIIDGMSCDGTIEILDDIKSKNKNIIVINNRKKFVSPGLNLAIAKASGEIILRMDVHTEYQCDYISQCVTTLLESGADNVGGPARTRSKTYIQKAVSIAYHSPFSVGGAKFHDVNFEGFVDTVTYGCWYKKTIEDLGLFDEELVRNQDDELNLRMIRSGKKIWQSPKIKSWYYPRASISSLFKQYLQYGYWKVRVIQKHRIPASIRHLIPGSFVLIVLLLLALAPFSEIAFLLLAALLGVYMVANFIASLITCFKPKYWKFLMIMPLTFASYHFGYGFGFLLGLIDFILLRKGGRLVFSKR
jgi:succinoglycan biosynthesis protein ExoA